MICANQTPAGMCTPTCVCHEQLIDPEPPRAGVRPNDQGGTG